MSEPFVFDPLLLPCQARNPSVCMICRLPRDTSQIPFARSAGSAPDPPATLSEGFSAARWCSTMSFPASGRSGSSPGSARRGRTGSLSAFSAPAGAGPALVPLPLLAGRRHRAAAGPDRLPQADGQPVSWQLTVYETAIPPRLVRGRCHIPNFSRPFLPPVRTPTPQGMVGDRVGPPGLGRDAGVAAGRGRGDPQPGLFRRLPGGALSPSWTILQSLSCDHAVPVPHL